MHPQMRKRLKSAKPEFLADNILHIQLIFAIKKHTTNKASNETLN